MLAVQADPARENALHPADLDRKGWWNRYADPQLDELVAEAISQSPTLAQIDARVRRADAMADQAEAAQAPQMDLAGGLSGTKASYWNGMPYASVPKGIKPSAQLRASLTWHLDVFGKNRAAIAASLSDAAATRTDAAEATLLLSSGIVDLYAELLGLYRETDLADQIVRLRTEAAGLTARRVREGLESVTEQARTERALSEARQTLAATEEARNQLRLRLAELIGARPGRAQSIGRPVPPALAPTESSQPIPADLLGARPDLRAARLRVEAEAFRVREARAGFYPSINLAAFIGPQVLGLDHFFDSASVAGSLGPAINLPIFHGGALKAGLNRARAHYDEAVASYNATLLHALQEVASLTASRRTLGQQLSDARQAERSAEQEWRVLQMRYRAGLAPRREAIAAEERAVSASLAIARLETRQYQLDGALVRALGGSNLPTP